MATINKILSGRLNQDVHPFRVPENDFIDALNITRDAEGLGQDKVVSNIVGNTLVPYTLPAGINKSICGRQDRLRNKYYYFVWNSNGFHSILCFNGDTNSIFKLLESKTDSSGIDILNFNPSNKIYNINIIHRDEGDLLFFIDSLDRPSYMNVDTTYTPWVRSYLDVAVAPPTMVPQVSYENDTNVQINNLRNSLFQFKYRFVYNDFQKSVYSSGSVIPLPYNPFLLANDSNKTYNARISVYLSTGDPSVNKIELWGRQITTSGSAPNDTTGEYFLIESIDKSDLSLNNNDIYRFVFYNDRTYTYGDLKEQTQLQDYVPLKANAQELPNGNTLIYGGITEGYDKVQLNMTVSTNDNWIPPVSTFNGLLFFAAQNGVESDPSSSQITIYLAGLGTNDGLGMPSQLVNSKAHYIVDCATTSGVSKKFQYQSTTQITNVSDILNGLRSAALGQGFSFISQTSNTLTVSMPNIVLYYAQPLKDAADNLAIDNSNDIHFSFPHQSAEQFAIQYFDEKGRTNGVTLPATNLVNTLSDAENISSPQITLSIYSRPPIWAKYYHILRGGPLTYNKHEFWVSSQTLVNVDPSTSVKYAYIDIQNMADYNQSIQGSIPVVGYEFVAGDRIRFLMNYPFGGTPYDLPIYDYEILGVNNSIIINGVTQTGRFLRITYPTADITGTFDFGGSGFQNYKILLYNYVKHASTPGTELYFEFGREYAIGNWGTVNAFHIGSDQTQTSTLSQPAIINITEGDLFYRYRTVPAGSTINLTTSTYIQAGTYSTFTVVASPPVSNSVYSIVGGPHTGAGLTNATYPTNANNDYTIRNVAAFPFSIRLRITYTVTPNNPSDHNGQHWLAVKLVNSSNVVRIIQILATQTGLEAGNTYTYTIDTNVTLQPTEKLWLISFCQNQMVIGDGTIRIDVIDNVTIPIIESAYSDKYAIITNSNNRPSVYDENARQTYYPTLVRFSLSYQEDTSINSTNRFYFDNQDSYDRGNGDIMRFHIRDRALSVYQKFKVGRVPILTQVVQDVSGNPLQANSDQLINKIQYYQGDYGIGDCPESLAWNNFADYFVDDLRGVVCRLSLDGIKPISIEFEMNAFFINKLKAFRKSLNNGIVPMGETYLGDPTVYGSFDAFTNKYIIALEEINRYADPNTLVFHQDAYTIPFSENDKAFEGFYSYKPEWIDCLNTLPLSLKNGQFWRHDSSIYCNFYGVQYDAFITVVFNASGLEKKTWANIRETANVCWDCPEITSQTNSYGSQSQQSNLVVSDFEVLENEYEAAFLRDSNSIGGIIDGDTLKGTYLIVKFRVQNASTFSFLNVASVRYIDSQLNAK